jgi:hypothetical protein
MELGEWSIEQLGKRGEERREGEEREGREGRRGGGSRVTRL